MKPIKPIRLIPFAIILLFPVPVWNVWLLDYINANGKLIPWVLTPVWPIIGTGAFLGFYLLRYPPKIKSGWNPFYGWFLFALIIEIFITAFSNT